MDHSLTLRLAGPAPASGHPWIARADLAGELPAHAGVATLLDAEGNCLGSGLFEPLDPDRVWRRFSHAGDVDFDQAYLNAAIEEALMRRGHESCQRLVHSDADYLPGLEVDLYDGVLTVTALTRAVDGAMDAIVDCLAAHVQPREIVFLHDNELRQTLGLPTSRGTLSGQNLKPRWVDIDGLDFRLDWLAGPVPCFDLDQREQQALVGSLCEGRRVFCGFARSSGFALQAARGGAREVTAVDADAQALKRLGAEAQKNSLSIATAVGQAQSTLEDCPAGSMDAVILDPPRGAELTPEKLHDLLVAALRSLSEGAVLAAYSRSGQSSMDAFERTMARAAAVAGREARIFARAAQPFDFPMRLNLPESCVLRGLIVEVE
jgi:23S rRNA (cytosine1962-C5)-methyltransferase